MNRDKKGQTVEISDNMVLHVEMGAESALCYLQIATKMLSELVGIAGVAVDATEEQRARAFVANERIALLETLVITPLINSVKVEG